MDILYFVLALICAVVGLIGAIVPALPGPPLSFVGLLLLLLCDTCEIGIASLVITGILAVVITILDYVAPVWFAKKKGGTTCGMWGATIGMLIGLFFGPLGIILGPFMGALVGELIAKTPTEKALSTAFMTFVAFMLVTGIKFIYCLVVVVYIVVEGFKMISNSSFLHFENLDWL